MFDCYKVSYLELPRDYLLYESQHFPFLPYYAKLSVFPIRIRIQIIPMKSSEICLISKLRNTMFYRSEFRESHLILTKKAVNSAYE